MGALLIGELVAVLGGLVSAGLGLTVVIILTKAIFDGTFAPERAEKWDHRHVLFPVVFTAAGAGGIFGGEGLVPSPLGNSWRHRPCAGLDICLEVVAATYGAGTTVVGHDAVPAAALASSSRHPTCHPLELNRALIGMAEQKAA